MTVPLASCNATLLDINKETNLNFGNGLLASQYCATDNFANSFTRKKECIGYDGSGGPIFLRDTSGVSTIVGILSFDIDCDTNSRSVYTRIASYADWIEGVVWS